MRPRTPCHGTSLAWRRNWLGKLPWKEPFFAAAFLAMFTFTLGGIGGAINAAYAMNAMVHNTAWIQGHFHLTVGTTVGLSFIGATYWWLPRLTGRELRFKWMAIVQPYMWFIGMMLFSIPNHIAGLLGLPRRVFDVTFLGAEQAESWIGLTKLSARGAEILFLSCIFYVVVVVATWLTGKKAEAKPFEFAKPLVPVTRAGIWDRLGLWTLVAVALIVMAYAYPLFHMLSMERFGSPGFTPF